MFGQFLLLLQAVIQVLVVCNKGNRCIKLQRGAFVPLLRLVCARFTGMFFPEAFLSAEGLHTKKRAVYNCPLVEGLCPGLKLRLIYVDDFPGGDPIGIGVAYI